MLLHSERRSRSGISPWDRRSAPAVLPLTTCGHCCSVGSEIRQYQNGWDGRGLKIGVSLAQNLADGTLFFWRSDLRYPACNCYIFWALGEGTSMGP